MTTTTPNPQLKRRGIIAAVLVLAFILWTWLKPEPVGNESSAPPSNLVIISGTAMGSPYNMRYIDEQQRNFKTAIDSLMDLFNQSLSTYHAGSEILRFNEGESITFSLPFFYPVLKRSYEIYQLTEGAFNPTINPVVRAWGFGPGKALPDVFPNVDSLLDYVDFESLVFDSASVRKTKQGVSLDFNSIAPGYGVDLVCEMLEKAGIENYMVEIGGELRCKGKNEKDDYWLIGIENPNYEEQGGQQIQTKVRLNNQSLATSGNYRRFYVRDGQRYAHTIDPKTGYPVKHSLLSATVIASDCTTADALATAMMVMGKEKAIELAARTGVGIVLIYDEGGQIKTHTSTSVQSAIVP
jgi:thiamine biosynthesis lipoprotein